MRLLDVNLLLYAVNEDAPHHERARTWLEGVLSGTETVAFTWHVLLAFLRISTHPVIFPQPLDIESSLDVVAAWLDRPCSVVLQPTERHLDILQELLRSVGTAGNLTSDAHLAAVALEHGAMLWSTDRDFARFAGVRWANPLDQ